MYVCMYVCTYYIRTYVYTYIYVCVCMYACMYVCMYICMYLYMCIHVFHFQTYNIFLPFIFFSLQSLFPSVLLLNAVSCHFVCLFQLFTLPFFLPSSRHMSWCKWRNMKQTESSDVPVLIFQTVRCRGADRDINPANEFRNSSSTLCHSPLAPRELVSPHPFSCITFTELSWGFGVH